MPDAYCLHAFGKRSLVCTVQRFSPVRLFFFLEQRISFRKCGCLALAVFDRAQSSYYGEGGAREIFVPEITLFPKFTFHFDKRQHPITREKDRRTQND